MRLYLVGKTNYDQPYINTITVQTKEGRKIVLDCEQTYYRYDEEGFMEMDWHGVYDYTSGVEKDVREEDLKGAIVTDIEVEDDLSTPFDYYFTVVKCVVISDSMETSDNFSLEVEASKEQALYKLNGLSYDINHAFSGHYMTFVKSVEEICEEIKGIKTNISKLGEKPKCEWIKYDYRTVCPKNHDIENPYWRLPEARADALKFCPYCGGEISKVGW